MSRRLAADAVLLAGTASVVALAGRREAAYEVSVWGPVGLLLVLTAATLVLRGLFPRRLAAAACALALLGVWSAASATWGGVPDEGWRELGRWLAAAAAVVVGGSLGAGRRRGLLLSGILLGVTAQAVELSWRLLGAHPETLFNGRVLNGLVGYHNGQAAVLATGLVLALWGCGARRPFLRLAAGSAAGLMLALGLLTQSRAGLAAAALAVTAQTVRSRDLRLGVLVAALAASVALLIDPLQRVDAVFAGGAAGGLQVALRDYMGWALAVALAAGLVALAAGALPVEAAAVRRTVGVALAAAVAAGLALAVVERPASLARPASVVSMLASDAAPESPPGSTRLVAFSLNGRRDAWRVGLDLARAHPLQGAGVGAFAKAWTRERSLTSLYILQPHSIEVELLGERGIIGLGLFAAFVASLLAAVVRAPARAASAAGLGVTIALLAQASFDWTWSFVGIVAPALAAAAAAASGERAAPTRSRLRALSLVPAALAVATIGTLYLADRQLSQGVAAAAVRPTAALEHARAATTLDPWLAEGYELQGRIAEAAGDFRLAAERYRTASGLSRRPWLDSFREARALDRLGLVEPTRQACAAAHRANPGEPMLSKGPCVR